MLLCWIIPPTPQRDVYVVCQGIFSLKVYINLAHNLKDKLAVGQSLTIKHNADLFGKVLFSLDDSFLEL